MQRKYAIGFDWMARTVEPKLRVSKEYGEALHALVLAYGRNRIADLAEVDPTTVHRNVNEGRLTYATALKLREALRAAAAEDKKPLPSLPEPFYPVVSELHYQWCQLGERLMQLPSEIQVAILNDVLPKITDAERDHMVRAANRQLIHPLPGRSGTDDSGD